MSITVKPYLLERRKKRNGEYPVYIRVTQHGKYSLVSIGISVEKTFWDSNKGRVKTAHPLAKTFNRSIQVKLHQAQEAIATDPTASRIYIANLLKDGAAKDFKGIALEAAERLADDGGYHRPNQIRYAAERMEELRGKGVSIDSITPDAINEFQRFLITEYGNHQNTVRKYVSCLKNVFSYALANNYTKNDVFASSKVEIVSSVENKKQALSPEQVKHIESLDIEPHSDIWHVRNYFLFSMYNAGIRFTDFATLRWSNIVDGRLIYKMGKTEKSKSVSQTSKALKILEYYRTDESAPDDYIFPIIKDKSLTGRELKKKAHSANAQINLLLKELQSMAGIQTNMSFHIARHTFARWARSLNMDIDWIGSALAHSKRATTERYLASLSEYNIDDGLKAMFDD
ncbi:MAG: site-specific integrase [Cyclobacteriaceae bacterium]|nr:site-specific integrase [Cyclobacteriaceae bacterium]